jgi:hypothetical protein
MADLSEMGQGECKYMETKEIYKTILRMLSLEIKIFKNEYIDVILKFH